MSEPIRLCLLVGFDRSGSSMIARVLAAHPDVELLFQPFNSTEVHRAQWQQWPPGEPHPATEAFLDRLRDGEIDRDYLASDWFDNHSTTTAVRPGALHVIKDTKLHFHLPWLEARVPEIPVWGMWRNPRAIVCSLMRNDYHRSWYGGVGPAELRRIIAEVDGLDPYADLVAGDLAEHERTALIVALRTHRLVRDLPRDRWLVYEEILADPNRAFGGFTAGFGLASFDFAPHAAADHNVIGKPYAGPDRWKHYFDAAALDDLDRIFARLPAPRS